MFKWGRTQVIKKFSCSTQLSKEISLLINMKMPTIVGIFIFISREIFLHSYVQQQFAIVSKLRFITGQISCSAELSMNKNFITSVRRASREEEIEEEDGNRDKQCGNRILITSKFINLLKILQKWNIQNKSPVGWIQYFTFIEYDRLCAWWLRFIIFISCLTVHQFVIQTT